MADPHPTPPGAAEATPNVEELRQMLADILDVDVAEITDDARFVEDLGCDSLLALEIVVALERKYAVTFREDELPKVTCLPQAYHLVTSKLLR